MSRIGESRWIRFLRNYGPIPTNDNMYDESIQRALRRLEIDPLILPTQFLEALLSNFRSERPKSEILTGTAGDGKTFHCRKTWLELGGSDSEWSTGQKIQRLQVGTREFVVVKDLSELRAEESTPLLLAMAEDVMDEAAPRFYLVAANHGQLLEKLKATPKTSALDAMTRAVEELLVTGENPNPQVRLHLRDLSQAPASEMLGDIIDNILAHPGWTYCSTCPHHDGAATCPIWENRNRLQPTTSEDIFRRRLKELIELGGQNGIHFPVRQLLALVANMLLGHPEATDGLMSCSDVPEILSQGTLNRASPYRNVFGENLKPRRAEKLELFRKLNGFGIGGETSNKVDAMLVYGADDPTLTTSFTDLVLSDPVYGGTKAFAQAQRDYLEGLDEGAREIFLPMLRSQRQRLFFTIPSSRESEFDLWDLTVFRYAGLFLELTACLRENRPLPRQVMQLIMRGLNRVFTGMLVQNQDELVLGTSGSHSQSKVSPLLDELISVPRQGGEEVRIVETSRGGVAISVRLSREAEPGVVLLPLTPTRFEFLGRVAEGALPSSFSQECHEDLLAFKTRLLSATQRRRILNDDESGNPGELVLRFIELGADGRATPRRVMLRV